MLVVPLLQEEPCIKARGCEQPEHGGPCATSPRSSHLIRWSSCRAAACYSEHARLVTTPNESSESLQRLAGALHDVNLIRASRKGNPAHVQWKYACIHGYFRANQLGRRTQSAEPLLAQPPRVAGCAKPATTLLLRASIQAHTLDAMCEGWAASICVMGSIMRTLPA